MPCREDYDNVAFLFVSDDMAWARRHLGDEEDVFFVSDGDKSDPASVGADLAVMALANATVVSRGTFSRFGRVLNGEEAEEEKSVRCCCTSGRQHVHVVQYRMKFMGNS